MKDFGRVITAMVTPFDEHLKVDYKQVKNLTNYLIENGSEGIVVVGTTGESPTLSHEEKLQMFQTVKDTAAGRATVIAGTGSYSTYHTIELTREAEKIGVDGVMLVAPYYNKPPQEGIYEHFKAVAQSTNLPILMYNVPGRTGANVLPKTVARLAKIDNIVGIKEACGNIDQVSEVKRLVNPDFLVYSGDDSLTLPMLAIGCHGVISVASHIVGNEIAAMVRYFFEGKIAEAGQIHLKLFNLCKALFVTTNPVPIKAALNLLNFKVGGLRLPLVSAQEDELNMIKKALIELGLYETEA